LKEEKLFDEEFLRTNKRTQTNKERKKEKEEGTLSVTPHILTFTPSVMRKKKKRQQRSNCATSW
jgi:hypothetical protein